MGRIGDFFKRAWKGIKSVTRKVIKVAPKVIDIGHKAISGLKPLIAPAPQNSFTDGAKKVINFADNALNKADQLVKAQQDGGVKGLINAGVNMIKR